MSLGFTDSQGQSQPFLPRSIVVVLSARIPGHIPPQTPEPGGCLFCDGAVLAGLHMAAVPTPLLTPILADVPCIDTCCGLGMTSPRTGISPGPCLWLGQSVSSTRGFRPAHSVWASFRHAFLGLSSAWVCPCPATLVGQQGRQRQRDSRDRAYIHHYEVN